jgi:hypothetical protein
MDRHSFEFGKAREKLVRVFGCFESGKFNFSNVLTA